MQSIWEKGFDMPGRGALRGDIEADALVVGAGIAGVNCAYRMRRAGLKVVVLEAERVGTGATSRTTGKITAQHGLIYDLLTRSFDARTAKLYARANQNAVEEYAEIVSREKIDCDFERADNFVFAREDTALLEAEFEALRAAGLDARLEGKTELPFPVKGAVGVSGQAHFHPLKYLRALAEKLEIYEHSRVESIEDNVARTEMGSVRARDIVVATHFPFINAPGYYFLRMHQERSAVMALEGAPEIRGMYIDEADGGLSFRPQGGALLVGSGSWRTGKNPGNQFAELRRKAKECYPDAREIAAWSSQDCMPQDHIPYIGRYAGSTKHLWVATGFGKWGMSSSMVAAMLLTDLITGASNEAADVFSPQRSPVRGIDGFAADVKETVKGFAKYIMPPKNMLEDIRPGEAGTVEYEGRKLGAYRDERGEIHLVSLSCPHLGCILGWNPDDLSWDCPCHGSRFDIDGALLDGPAQRNLAEKEDES
ncbi:MAG: FAD-dependent oxidoreductase [Clostridiales bacterium]|nr:FAD-dependent oxidoreductase [Clostridiales bacterium]